MKNKLIDITIISIFIFILIEVLSNKLLIANTISASLNLWVNSLIPSMFPIFIISDILINYHITNYIPKIIKNTFIYIFNVNEHIVTIFFLSLLSGFPNGARLIKTLYQNHTININDANHALTFTHFSNPIFILTTIGVFFLHSEKYGYIILISHYLGNVIIGIITRNNYNNTPINYTKNNTKSQNFSTILINSIKSTIDSLLMILGTVTIFLILSALITNKLNLDSYTSSIIKGLLEMTIGIKSLSKLLIPNIYKVVISTMFISFGGLSIHLQVLSQITDTNLSYKQFFIARIFHSIISGLISCILFLII